MATTAQDVFNIALALIDETDDTGELRSRALPILTVLKNELFRYSDTFSALPALRPSCDEISDFTSPLGIDDALAQSVMPYGLASHLLLDVNPVTASFFQQRYEELLLRIGSAVPTVSEPIEDVYRIILNQN